MMKVIAPLRVNAIAADRRGTYDTGIVKIAFRDQRQMPAAKRCQVGHLRGELFEKVHGRGVHDRVHGIDAQRVEMIVTQPHQGIVAKKSPHGDAVRAVEIYRLPPRRGVTIGEIGSEASQIVPRRSHMVVNDVEDHGRGRGRGRRRPNA